MLLVSCATLQVAVDYNPDFDFSSIRTYAWLPDESPPGTDLRVNNALINDRVVAAVDARLEAKGYRKADSGAPDVYVTWLGAIDSRIRVDTINDYYGSSWYGSYRCCWGSPRRTLVSEYEEGTLIIDVLNSVDRKLPRKKPPGIFKLRLTVFLRTFLPASREAGGFLSGDVDSCLSA